jgi:translation elongation factor EF-1alpha
VFEFPERRVRGASMKDVAHCRIRLANVPLSQVDLPGQRTFVKPVHVQLTDKG